MFLRKVVLKICRKFTGEHPCRSEITLRHGCSPVNFLHIFIIYFPKNTSGWLLLKIPTNDLVKLAEFVLKSNLFELKNENKKQISGTTIGTKFAPPYAYIYMDKTKTDFLKTQELQPFVWSRYIDDIFLFGRMEKQN